MEGPLRIFISHKMPTDTPLAQEIGSKLALYAGNQVKVAHAGTFRYGDAWRQRIQEELDQTHWLILLYTDQDEDWGFCLFECGYFRHIMEGDESQTKRLITFCRKPEQINDALKEFNALLVNAKSVTDLLEDIYLKAPWNIKSDLERAILMGTANEIANEFIGSERIIANFDVAPSVTIELTASDQVKVDLQHGRMPAESMISGTKDWQRLFGREINTGGWMWRDLTEYWPFVEVYEFLIAKMISDALEARMPKGTILRAPDTDGYDTNGLYRMTLRRYERMGGSKYRFYFTPSPLDLPIDLPAPGRTAEETVLYNLVSLTWYFRRRVVDQLYERILEVISMNERNRPPVLVKEVYDSLGRELMQVAAQSIIRRLDNILSLKRALGRDDSETQLLLERIETYGDLQKQIFQAMQDGANGLQSIAHNLHSMAMLNYDLYHSAAAKYASLARELPLPSDPPERCPT